MKLKQLLNVQKKEFNDRTFWSLAKRDYAYLFEKPGPKTVITVHSGTTYGNLIIFYSCTLIELDAHIKEHSSKVKNP